MDAKAIVITSGKGGVGKTTTTANIGVALATLGEKVVVVDTDVGLRNLDVVMGLEGRVVYDLVDIIEGRCRLRQALIRDKRVNELYLLPASQTRDKSAVSPEAMKVVVKDLCTEFDRVLIDCPAGIEQGFKTAAAGAQAAIIVANPEVSSVRDADRVIGILEAHEIKSSLLVNRLRPDMVARGDMLAVEDVLEILAVELLGVIPEDENILISTNEGVPAVLRNGSAAGRAFLNVARRIRGEVVPLLPLKNHNGLFGRFRRFIRGA